MKQKLGQWHAYLDIATIHKIQGMPSKPNWRIMFKLLQNQICEVGGLYAVLHMSPTLTSTTPSTTTQGDIVRVSPANITLL